MNPRSGNKNKRGLAFNLVGLIMIFLALLVSSSRAQYAQGLTPVPDELVEKVIMLYGEHYGTDMYGKDLTSYRQYPIYDLEGNIIAYDVMYYYGEGELPSDEKLFEIAEKIYGKYITRKEREEIEKEAGLYENVVSASIGCCYEISPMMVAALGQIAFIFRCYAENKSFLEQYSKEHEIDISGPYELVEIYGDSPYLKYVINGEEKYINFRGQKSIHTKGELIDRVKPIDELYPGLPEINREKWKFYEELAMDLELD